MIRNLNRVPFFELIWDSLMSFEREGQRMSTLGPHSECNGAYPVDRIRHTVTLSLSDEMEAFEVSKDVGNARSNSPSTLLLSQFSAFKTLFPPCHRLLQRSSQRALRRQQGAGVL